MKIILAVFVFFLYFHFAVFAENSTASPENSGNEKKKQSLFFVDPKRLQKANEINFNDFDKKIEITPNPLSLKEINNSGGINPSFKVVFTLRNMAKRTYLLSFPNAQRYEIVVKNSKGESIYNWSDDKEFTPIAGAILVNPNDKLTFAETLPVKDFSKPLDLQSYLVEIKLSSYPELKASASLTVTP